MEPSSPLAAMMPGGHRHGLGHFAFSFTAPDVRDHQLGAMRPPPPPQPPQPQGLTRDYFSAKPLPRGSSPTASLAADLSQNFHLDQSPQWQTPRRALFTSALFNNRDAVTTPPLPSSSPAPGHPDAMDISPLPHKPAFTLTTEVQPTPDTPEETMTTVPHAIPASSPMEQLPELPPPRRPLAPVERRAPNPPARAFPRPALSKNHTTANAVTLKSLQPSNPISLGECFTSSPPAPRQPTVQASRPAPVPYRPRPAFPSAHRSTTYPASGAATATGSVPTTTTTTNAPPPSTAATRKPAASLTRPRKQFRRSLSMFENPRDVVKGPPPPMPAVPQEDASTTTTNTLASTDTSPVLPHYLPADTSDNLPRLTPSTLVEVMDGKYASLFAEQVIIDCRFEYEFEGGHIQGARNYNNKETLAQQLFPTAEMKLGAAGGRRLLVFHCEYSAHRAPIMAQFIRGQDRAANAFRYPALTYPEIYILEGGYSAFYGLFRPRCFPPAYVEMAAKEHANTCEREMGRFRQRAKLARAQTFAFGTGGGPSGPMGPGRQAGAGPGAGGAAWGSPCGGTNGPRTWDSPGFGTPAPARLDMSKAFGSPCDRGTPGMTGDVMMGSPLAPTPAGGEERRFHARRMLSY